MRHPTETTDAELIADCRAGRPGAFRQLVLRFEPAVAATVIGMLGPGPDADEVGQNVFVRFHRSLGQFRGEAALSTYLIRIAMNESLTALRRRKRWYQRFRPLSDDDRSIIGTDLAADAGQKSIEQADVIRRALDRLPEVFRSVVVLRHFQGLSTRETASVLAIPEGTVVSRLARAHGKLRTLLEPYHHDTP